MSTTTSVMLNQFNQGQYPIPSDKLVDLLMNKGNFIAKNYEEILGTKSSDLQEIQQQAAEKGKQQYQAFIVKNYTPKGIQFIEGLEECSKVLWHHAWNAFEGKSERSDHKKDLETVENFLKAVYTPAEVSSLLEQIEGSMRVQIEAKNKKYTLKGPQG